MAASLSSRIFGLGGGARTFNPRSLAATGAIMILALAAWTALARTLPELAGYVSVVLFVGSAAMMLWMLRPGQQKAARADLADCACADSDGIQNALSRERERLRLALEAGSLAVWDYDPRTDESKFDMRYAVTMGFGPEVQTLSRPQIGERMHPDDLPRVAAEHDALVARGSDYHIEFRIVTPSGDIRWLVSQGIALKDDPSNPGRMVGILQDITDRKRREEDLRALAATRELLVREADHRIKNSLQLVTSLLSVQLRGIADPAAADALRGAIARVGSIAASHLALQASENLKDVDLTVTLRALCGHFSQLHPAIAIIYRPDGALMMDADRAIPLALVVSEVLTNALRHAFPEGMAGAVTIDAAAEQSHLIVRVSDNGVGMEPQTEGDGLGSRIIRSLAAGLSATIDIQSSPQAGTAVTLRLPLSNDQ